MTETAERTHKLHDYTTLEPDWLTKHQPRTIEHMVTNPENNYSLSLMSEIGDGVFVAWDTCSKCRLHYTGCTCVGGPQEPEWLARRRAERWDRSFDARPELRGDLIPAVLTELEARGYTISHSNIEEMARLQGVGPADPDKIAIPDLTEQERDDFMEALEETRPPHLPDRYEDREVEDVQLPERVDAGLDEALDKVRAAKRDLSNIPDEF